MASSSPCLVLVGALALVATCVFIGSYAGSELTREDTSHFQIGPCVGQVTRSRMLLQLGAHLAWRDHNDPLGGLIKNPIWQKHSQALLVEPQRHIFNSLQRHVNALRTQAVHVVHAAICEHEGDNVTFYSVSQRVDPVSGALRYNHRHHSRATTTTAVVAMPRWTSQVGSLSRETVVRSLPVASLSRTLGRRDESALASELIEETSVRCESPETLLHRHHRDTRNVSALVMDLEGSDADILANPTAIDLEGEAWRGLRIVFFEHKHAKMPRLCMALRKLARAGFTCECDGTNVLCIRRGASGTRSGVCSTLQRRPMDPLGTCADIRHLSKLRHGCLTRPGLVQRLVGSEAGAWRFAI